MHVEHVFTEGDVPSGSYVRVIAGGDHPYVYVYAEYGSRKQIGSTK